MALCIGIDDYKPPLKPLGNCVNDASDMADACERMGFETHRLINPNFRQMRTKVKEIGALTQPGSTVLFYFSGHGVQHLNKNYLLPLEMEYHTPDDYEYEACPVNLVLKMLNRSPGTTNLIFLDWYLLTNTK